MTFLDYLSLMRRNAAAALLITLLITGTTLCLVLYKNRSPYVSTIFVSIGNAQNGNQAESSSYDRVQAADHFTETVQGWFKNPEFQKRIRIEGSSETSVRKQEKQNLVLSFTSENAEAAKKMNENTKSELQREIDTFNSVTNNEFKIAIYSENIEKKQLPVMLFLIISVIGGAILSSFAIYGYEYLFRFISSPSQAEAVTQKTAIEILPGVKTQKEKLQFLAGYLYRREMKRIQLIGARIETAPIAKSIQALVVEKTVHSVLFPQESGKIAPQNHHIVVCALGRTTENDIRRLRTLLSDTFDLLIVEA